MNPDKPSPIVFFGDPNLNDRQLMLLMLYQISELRAEVRGLANLNLKAHKTVVSPELFGTMCDKAHDAALKEIEALIPQIQQMQKPGLQ